MAVNMPADGPGGTVKKSDREIMEILEAYDATGVAHSAAELCDADPKTVRRYAQARDAGRPVNAPVRRPKLIDPFLEKIEEWVERSEGKVRADIVHDRLAAMEFAGDERTTRRAVAAAKARWRAGHRRTYRPWITEPGLWLQWDWGKGPLVPGPDRGAAGHAAVLRVAGVVPVPGGAAHLGPDAADADRVPGCDAAADRRGDGLRADR